MAVNVISGTIKANAWLSVPKEISEDWSDILWSERCEVSLKDENNQEQFNELLDALDLNVVINKSIEKSGALGTCATVVSVYDIISEEDKMTLDVSNAKTRVDVVDVTEYSAPGAAATVVAEELVVQPNSVYPVR